MNRGQELINKYSDNSFSSIDSIEHNARGDNNTLHTVDELGGEWSSKNIGKGKYITTLPYISDRQRPHHNSETKQTEVKAEKQDVHDAYPFECPLCFGPIIEATTPLCGHLFCRDCILTCKKLFNACPLCRHSLKILHRVYAVDNWIENYMKNFALVSERGEYLEIRKSRVQQLISQNARIRESYFYNLKRKWEDQCFRFRSKGFFRGTLGLIRDIWQCLRRQIPNTSNWNVVFVAAFFLFLGMLLDRHFQSGCSIGEFITYWYNHMAEGFKHYCCHEHPPPDYYY